MTAETGFIRKKVESLTLGEKLRKLRNDSRTSLQEISKATRIQVKYLEYLENGEYAKLPADVYVRGFLRSYARYLNIDEQVFIRLYERERNIQVNLGRDMGITEDRKDFSLSSLVITPRSIVVVAIACLIGGVFFYLYQEFRNFTAAPYLVIAEPVTGSTIHTNEVIVLGKTDRGARLSINGQSVFVGDNGGFSEKLLLQPGLNLISVVSVNRFDKERIETVALEADYAPLVSETPYEKTEEDTVKEVFSIDISVKDVPVVMAIQSDGVAVFSGTLKSGESRHIEAKNIVLITSENGEQTLVQFNKEKPEPLSSSGGMVKDVTFLPSGRKE